MALSRVYCLVATGLRKLYRNRRAKGRAPFSISFLGFSLSTKKMTGKMPVATKSSSQLRIHLQLRVAPLRPKIRPPVTNNFNSQEFLGRGPGSPFCKKGLPGKLFKYCLGAISRGVGRLRLDCSQFAGEPLMF